MKTNVHAAQEKPASVQKKVLLGLQLDMASWWCLVGVCGHGVAKSALAPRLREEKRNEQNRFTAQLNAHFDTWVTCLPIEINVHVANIFDKCHKYQHLFLTLENLNFKFVTLTRAASQPVAFCPIFFIHSHSIWWSQLWPKIAIPRKGTFSETLGSFHIDERWWTTKSFECQYRCQYKCHI